MLLTANFSAVASISQLEEVRPAAPLVHKSAHVCEQCSEPVLDSSSYPLVRRTLPFSPLV